ncbi:Aminotran-1-2 domain-containing protein [Mycena venus]|uniref:Aminotran-1-2 domain-containing protein n=1 Tax=Mycena venus TaxID=2733690 RepID=A0A8H6Y5Z0_9AGAR|nr:Aminotran-1-2 domain-containing protein [Mycena venus]
MCWRPATYASLFSPHRSFPSLNSSCPLSSPKRRPSSPRPLICLTTYQAISFAFFLKQYLLTVFPSACKGPPNFPPEGSAEVLGSARVNQSCGRFGPPPIICPHLIGPHEGLPSPEYFPFSDVSANVLAANSFPTQREQGSSSFSWFWRLLGADKERTTSVTVPKYPVRPEDINLATVRLFLAISTYPNMFENRLCSMSSGIPQLQKIVKEFSDKVYKPAYSNYTTLLHAGNTDAWNKVVTTLCNPGEGVLVSKWTYPSAMASMQPYNIRPVPVDIDSQGMRSDALRTILTEWDAEARGMSRPRVIYAVPIGENPTGTTTRVARKKEIYQICVEFDIILVEDDPYFVLQEGPYVPKSQRARHSQNVGAGLDEEKFIASLEPSYLRFDYQGRVIRLDTFSKTIAPGCRLGWYTCNPLFAERLERASETSTQAPCGLGQSLVTATLQEWGYEGYIRWLKALRLQYTMRRDFFVDCLAEEFQLTVAPGTTGSMWEGSQVYRGFAKPQRSLTGYFNEKAPTMSNPMISFVPPTSGMFVWLKVHFEQHPSFKTMGAESLELQLWTEIAEAGVLFGPGAIFSATGDWSSETSGHFRVSFSNLENDEMKKAVEIFGKTIRKFMGAL